LEPAVRALAADAETDGHLEILAEAALGDPALLLCGTAGLAAALARQLKRRQGRGQDAAGGIQAPLTGDRWPEDGGAHLHRTPGGSPRRGFLFVVGSKSSRARAQLDMLDAQAQWVARVDVELGKLQENSQGASRAVREVARKAAEALRHRGAAAIGVKGVAEGLRPETITFRLAEAVQCVEEMAPPDTLLLTGGETAASVLKALGAGALEIVAEHAPGVVISRIRGGRAEGAYVVTKAGSFGRESLLLELAEAWRRKFGEPAGKNP
ncbi:MAG TPA: nucleotide-binding domain containing protein, partial [Limnochordia bacterium]|nr:nucleotide-binding domain containing protein [Limnochordia bacterium]